MNKVTTTNQKKKGFFSAELTISMVVAMLLLGGAFIAYPEYKSNANRTTATADMKMMKTGVISYSGLAKDSKPPSNLGQLLANPSLAADDAIDNVDHGPFLDKKKQWTTDGTSIKDPWGEAYDMAYDESTGTGTISSKGGGKPLSISF